MAKLIFGCGYLGRRVAQRWRDSGQEVHVVTRFGDRARRLEREGFQPIVADVTRPASLANLPVAQTVLYAIGYDRTAGASMYEVYVHGLQATLQALPLETGKFIYTSSTGVYGQVDGEWVDEDSPCRPQREGGKACLAAEQILQAHPLAPRAIILRLAGIYGPGRIPRKQDLLANRPLAAAEDGYVNLIHVDDAASVVLVADERCRPPRTYVVSDGHPVQRRAYFEELARLLRAPPPRFEPAPISPAAARAGSDKQINNSRMLADLQVALAYPSYREGLSAILAAEQAIGGQL